MSEFNKSNNEWLGESAKQLARSMGRPVSTLSVALSGTTNHNATALTAGSTVRIVSDADCFLKVSSSSTDAATTSDCPLFSKVPAFMSIDSSSTYLHVITSGGTGTLWITTLEN